MKNLLIFLTISALFASVTSCTTRYYIVRHAEKASNPASDPPLTQAGHQRAIALCDTLRHKNVKHIFVSQYLRTQQTAAPSASLLQLTPLEYDAGQNASVLATQLRALNNNALVVGHSNTVPALILSLTGTSIGTIPENDFDNFYVVKRYKGLGSTTYTLELQGTYGAPSP